jgi:hypothetical protein
MRKQDMARKHLMELMDGHLIYLIYAFSIISHTGEYRVSCLLLDLEFCYISLYSQCGKYSPSTFRCFSLLVVNDFIQNVVYFSVLRYSPV